MNFEKLSEPISIGGVTLRNRTSEFAMGMETDNFFITD